MKEGTNQLVSIVTAFYNEERFLEETINSVKNQHYTNWEMILVDDGSSDNSTRIAKEYALANPGKIIYTEHQDHINKGLSASRNHGISISKGSLIALIDADDVWLPQKLSLQVSQLEKYPEAAMLCEASEYWYSWHPSTRKDRTVLIGKEQDKLFSPPQLAEQLYPLANGASPCPSGIIVRRSAVDKHDGFEAHFTEKYQLYEDQAFLLKMYLNEFIVISSHCNNRYRQREGSLVHKITKEGNYDSVRKYFLAWLEKYLNENNITYPRVWKLLQKAKRKYQGRSIEIIRNLLNL